MRKYPHVVLAVFAAAGLLFCAGCNSSSDDLPNNVKFKNESSSTVYVSPDEDETFEPFQLAPGETHTVLRVGVRINYTFTANGNVDGIAIDNQEVIFVDPLDI